MNINITDIIPSADSILAGQGIKPGSSVNQKIKGLYAEALELFTAKAHPVSLINEIQMSDFERIFKGEGENEAEAPLAIIYPQAEFLALFALTLGAEVSKNIEQLFQEDNFPLGYMLDSIASCAADNAVEVIEVQHKMKLVAKKITGTNSFVSSYSPGYCGWHISAQKKLFQYLKPEKIGISLNDSFLMDPLKSVTGVLVTGKREIHQYSSTYSFCQTCKSYSCEERMERLEAG